MSTRSSDEDKFAPITRDLRYVPLTKSNLAEALAAENEFVSTLLSGLVGRFLSIGAYTGIDHTSPLIERGWRGAYVEPNAWALIELLKNTESFKERIQIVNSAITVEGGTQRFYSSNKFAFASSFQPDWLAKQYAFAPSEEGHDMRETFVSTLTFRELFRLLGQDFDFISIDVEGLDKDLVLALEPEFLKTVKLLCFEQCERMDLILEKLEAIGFKFSHQTAFNNYFMNTGFFDLQSLRLKAEHCHER